ncbi:MAG: D-aminoacyl-tRNA deacylase [Treponema sp.]|jgi:D-tyrosyl-tRNA(Tyr) deacylase|nr:D-aminoacyl-tRNA deacylase [Treponema sp.]
MKAVLQRVFDASVTVLGNERGRIRFGLLAYLGVALNDTEADADWLAEKTVNLRVFDDDDGKMNRSIRDIVADNTLLPAEIKDKPPVNHVNGMVNNVVVNGGFGQVNRNHVNHDFEMVNSGSINHNTPDIGVLAVSQFTLLGDARKGRRPSWGRAAPPETARRLYEYFAEKIRALGVACECGEFQAHMQVHYTNDGPVTILLDSRE